MKPFIILLAALFTGCTVIPEHEAITRHHATIAGNKVDQARLQDIKSQVTTTAIVDAQHIGVGVLLGAPLGLSDADREIVAYMAADLQQRVNRSKGESEYSPRKLPGRIMPHDKLSVAQVYQWF